MNSQNIGSANLRLVLIFGIAAVAAVVPFWVTALPAAIDLPQHLSQVWLLDETIAGRRPELIVTPWYYPNTLVYWVLYAFWKTFSPLIAGRLILSTLAVLWLAGTLALQQYRKRPIEHWLIAAPIVFNFLFNWGLLNFLIGWPIFCIFMLLVRARPYRGQLLAATIAALMLYFAHALWFAMATVWLLVMLLDATIVDRIKLSCAIAPGGILALLWYPQLATSRKGSGVDTDLFWATMPHQRLDYERLTNSVFGSLHGELEQAIFACIVIWILITVTNRRRYLESETDRSLLVAALLMILGYWMLPEVYMNTMFFSRRWLPFGITLLLLSLPAPRISRAIPFALGIGFLTILSATTAKYWENWEKEHLSGFFEALSYIGPEDNVLALNVNDGSLFLKGRPGLQLFAYAQALQKADIFFSFTEHYSGPVQYKSPPEENPERRLVWFPGEVQRANVAGYTKVIINGDKVIQQFLAKKLDLEPMDRDCDAQWQTYRSAGKPASNGVHARESLPSGSTPR